MKKLKKGSKKAPHNPSRHSKLIYFKDLYYEKIDLQKIYELESIYWDSFIASTEIDKDSVNLLSNEKELVTYIIYLLIKHKYTIKKN